MGFDVIPQSVGIFADTPTPTVVQDGATVSLFPSDHFGVVAGFALTAEESARETLVTRAAAAAAAATSSLGTKQPGSKSRPTAPAAAAAPPSAVKHDGGADGAAAGASAALPPPTEDVLRLRSQRTDLVRAYAPFQPHLRSALVVFPPPSLTDAINQYRSGRDKAYPRWMPHATLQFPFVAPSRFIDAIDLITARLAQVAAAGRIRPFRAQLIGNNVTYFPNRRAVAYLPFEDADNGPLDALYQEMSALFPMCGRDKAAEADEGTNPDAPVAPLQPHVTLGQPANSKELNGLLDLVRRTWTDARFAVTEMHLIAHLDGTDGYQVIHTFSLGTPDAAMLAWNSISVPAPFPAICARDTASSHAPPHACTKPTALTPAADVRIVSIDPTVAPTSMKSRGLARLHVDATFTLKPGGRGGPPMDWVGRFGHGVASAAASHFRLAPCGSTVGDGRDRSAAVIAVAPQPAHPITTLAVRVCFQRIYVDAAAQAAFIPVVIRHLDAIGLPPPPDWDVPPTVDSVSPSVSYSSAFSWGPPALSASTEDVHIKDLVAVVSMNHAGSDSALDAFIHARDVTRQSSQGHVKELRASFALTLRPNDGIPKPIDGYDVTLDNAYHEVRAVRSCALG
jgi:2'-5' RNA ligase